MDFRTQRAIIYLTSKDKNPVNIVHPIPCDMQLVPNVLRPN